MFIKRSKTIEEISGVTYMNGTVKLGSVSLNVCSFVTDGVLIDTGASRLLPVFKSFFDEADFDKVVITHHHEDHTGGARYIQETKNAPIYMNEKMIESVKKRATYPLYRKIFWGVRKPFDARPIGEMFESRSAKWTVIETPGHAIDHVAFLNQETGQLFSGDLFVHPETKLILREESIQQIIESIERVLTYDFGEMFCCHAGYVKDGKKAFKKKHSYLTELRDRVLDLAAKGYTADEIYKRIFPKTYPLVYFSFGEWHSKHIIHSILRDGRDDEENATTVP